MKYFAYVSVLGEVILLVVGQIEVMSFCRKPINRYAHRTTQNILLCDFW